MPVEDLIRYFNLADAAGDSTLYVAGDHVEAWHRNLHLGSLFQPIVDLSRENIVGHQASLTARSIAGTALDAAEAYRRCESDAALVHFDRLCRTLHALNFLAQQRVTGGYLQVPIHPRHLLAVQNQHGLVYEAILKRCGLAPADIVLAIDLAALENIRHFTQALASYRERGYRLAIGISDDIEVWRSVALLSPDILRLKRFNTDLAREAQAQGTLIELTVIDSGNDYQEARKQRVDLGLGQLLGEPLASCRPTHKHARNP